MTRIAGDPPQLLDLAEIQRDAALGFVTLRSRLGGPLPSMPSALAAVVADGLGSASQRIALVADGLMEQATNLETAAHYFELADMAGFGASFSNIANGILMKAITPDGSLAEWSVGDWVGYEDGASVEDIAAAFAGVNAAQRNFLVTTYADEIGSLDGAPLEMRFAANRILVREGLAELTAERARLEALVAELSDAGWRSDLAAEFPWTDLNDAKRELDFVTKKLETLEYLENGLDERQILLFDASGDGRVAEVFGDIENADHIAFVLPGITNDLGDYVGGLRTDADNLYLEASKGAGNVAVISWLGYNPPDSLADGAVPTEAFGAAEDLKRSVDGIRVHSDPTNVTVVGHSYGSVVTGRAIRDEGLQLTDAILVGSPGIAMDVNHRSDLGTGVGDVWVAEAPKDFVPDLPFVHGPNPADDEWGGRPFETNRPSGPPVSGHSAYLDPDTESLRNVARIMTGRDDKVST